MTTTMMDFEAARANLRGELAKTEAALARARDHTGELALDCTLGAASQSELEAARAEQAELSQRETELQAALAKVDEREAAHKAAEAEADRERKRERIAECGRTCAAAAADVVRLAGELGQALGKGTAAASEAAGLSKRLGLGALPFEHWRVSAQRIANARLGQAGIFGPGELEAAERRLAGKEG